MTSSVILGHLWSGQPVSDGAEGKFAKLGWYGKAYLAPSQPMLFALFRDDGSRVSYNAGKILSKYLFRPQVIQWALCKTTTSMWNLPLRFIKQHVSGNSGTGVYLTVCLPSTLTTTRYSSSQTPVVTVRPRRCSLGHDTVTAQVCAGARLRSGWSSP